MKLESFLRIMKFEVDSDMLLYSFKLNSDFMRNPAKPVRETVLIKDIFTLLITKKEHRVPN